MVDSPSPYVYNNPNSIKVLFPIAAKEGIGSVTKTIEAVGGSFPATHKKQLENAIENQVIEYKHIHFLELTRQGKLIIVTDSAAAATEV